MVKIHVYEDFKHAKIELSYYDNPNQHALKKVEKNFRIGGLSVSELGVGLEYYEFVELCRDKKGYFFEANLLRNADKSYDSLDSFVSGIFSSLPKTYPDTKIKLVPVYYTVKNHDYINNGLVEFISKTFLKSNSEFFKSCRGLNWLERKRFSMAYGSLFCF